MGLQENKQDLEDVPGVEDLKFHDVKSSVLHTEQIPERRGVEMPPLVQELSVDERNRLERKLLWKIDLRILPMIILMYILNYLDRNNIAAARLAGLEDDLRLKGTEYQTCVSILFVGYVLMQIPSNLFLNKIGKPGLYLPSAMIIWGVISGATGAVHNFGGLIACRFILGFVEAAYFPGCLFYLSSWYTRKELGLRTAILFMGSLLSGAFSGLIAAGITNGMDDKAGLASWRWLFIIEGIITVVVAFCGYFILPNFPRTTFWLSETERQLAVWRLEEDIGEDDWTSSEQQTFTYGIRLAITDIKTWILMIMLFCIASSASVINFFPSVVETLGYGSIQSLLLTAPPYLLCVITAGLTAWSADRTGERYFHVTIPIYVAIIANVIAATTTAVAPRYLSMMLMIPGVYSSYSVVLAWISNSMPRPVEKRAAALAAINAVGNCANIFGSFMYPSSQAPRYVVAMSINCATAAVAIVAATVLRVVLVRLNKKLDHGKTVEGMTDFSIARNAHSLKLRCEWGIRNAVFHVARDPETKGLLGVAMWLPPTPASTPQTWSSYLSGWSLWVNQGLTNLRFGHGGLDVHRYWIWKSCQSECQRDIWTDPNGYWFCNIVVVQPGEQGKGVGKKLFEQVTKQADKEGRKCYLESSRDIPNTAIYERLGFKKVREMKCVDERDGVGCQLYCMVREPKRSGADDTQQAST